MKKILALCLVLILAIGLCACASQGEAPAAEDAAPAEAAAPEEETAPAEELVTREESVPEDTPVGVYKLVEAQSDDGENTTPEEIALMEAMGLICYLELTEDGQASLSMFGEEMTGTWQDDEITMEGDTTPFVLEGDTLTVSQEGMALVFARTDPEALAAAQENTFLSGLEDFAVDSEASELAAARSMTEYLVDGDGVIIDNDSCRVTITKYDPDGDWGFTVKLSCENKTEDQTLMFSANEAVVNGYAIDPFFGTTVAPGKIANESLEFDNTSLDEAGIASVDEILLSFVVYDDDDWMADHIADETIALYPSGLTADDIIIPERTVSESEQVVVDNDDVTFVILGVEEDSFWGYALKVFVENKTADEIMISWDDVSVNGFMVDPYWATSVPANAREYGEISFSDSDFEENGIESVDEIEYTLSVNNYDTWDELMNEVFTYTPAS